MIRLRRLTYCHKHQPAIQNIAEEKRDNPFDVLASLKGKLN